MVDPDVLLHRIVRKGESMPTLKLFYAPWSSRCRTQEEHLRRAEHRLRGDYRVETVDVEQAQDVAHAYGVHSLPTVIVETDAGVVERFGGVTSSEELEHALERDRRSAEDP